MSVRFLCSLVLCFCLVGIPIVGHCDDTTDTAIKALSSDLTLKSVNVSNERITSSDATGLKSIMLEIIGDYETVVTDYVYSNGSYTSHSVNVERDWSWIMTCALFIVVIYCFFKAIGGLIKWK